MNNAPAIPAGNGPTGAGQYADGTPGYPYRLMQSEIPLESGEARLLRYLEFVKYSCRESGIIEVVLVPHQVVAWGKLLKKHGFVVVNDTVVNSNSGNKLTVYHLDTSKWKKPKPKPKSKPKVKVKAKPRTKPNSRSTTLKIGVAKGSGNPCPRHMYACGCEIGAR